MKENVLSILTPFLFLARLPLSMSEESFTLPIEVFKNGDGKDVSDHYVEVPNFYKPPNNAANAVIESMSVCIRFKVNMLVEQYLFSIKESKSQVMLKIKDTSKGTMFFGLNGKTWMNLVPPNMTILPASWNHFCASFHQRKLLPVFNGILLHNDLGNQTPLSMTGKDWENRTLVIGFDYFGNQKNKLLRNIFHGELTELFIARTSMSLKDMIAVTKDCVMASMFMKGKFMFDWDSHFADRNKIMRSKTICKTTVGITLESVLFPYQITTPEAIETCDAYGGSILSPMNKGEGDRLARKFDVSSPSMLDNICNSYVLTGIVQGDTITSWVDVVTNKDPPFEIPWQPGQPNGRHIDKCTRFRMSKGIYSDVGCSSSSQCFICHMKTSNVFHLRGLTSDLSEFVDSTYSVNVNGSSGMREFIGFYKSKITYVEDRQEWQILPLFGELQTKISMAWKNPLGAKKWLLNGTDFTKLKLTQCGQEGFACQSNGVCLTIDKRCNGNYDCDDYSDENGCEVKVLPMTYRKILPPEGATSQVPLVVNVSLEVVKINSVEEINMEFNSVVKVTMTWIDKRVTFKNLKKDKYANMMSGSGMNELWLPGIRFVNSIDLAPDSVTERDFAVVERFGHAEANPLEQVDEDLIFMGKHNPISLIRTYKVNFNCKFNLMMFPFDLQECPIYIEPIITTEEEKVKLVLLDIKYSGSKVLFQYDVLGTRIGVPEDGSSGLKAVIELKRIINHHLAITFLPSLCLVLIAELTMFIDIRHFEATIMVALTSMLVMYTLYQSVADSLPQTPYLKMIDIWLLAGLVIPFAVYIFLISLQIMADVNLAEEVDEKGLNQITKVYPANGDPYADPLLYQETSSRSKKCSKICKGLILAFTAAFVMIYWSVAVAHFFSFYKVEMNPYEN